MRVLITGASGLLGLNLALEAAGEAGSEERHTVLGTVNSHTLRTAAFQVVKIDLTAPSAVERLVEKTEPDWIINCAALANVDVCENYPDLAFKMNVDVPKKLAAAVARGGARLMHISTDAVFDGQRGEYTEADAPNPQGVYARTKLQGEKVVLEANPSAAVARVNLYGWSLSGERSLAEFFFYNLVAGNRVMGFTDVYFCPLLVNDLAYILLRMMELELSGLYHAVSSQCLSKYDFGVALAKKFGLDSSLIVPGSVDASGLKAARSPNLSLCSNKLASLLGGPLPGLELGLERFYKLYQAGYSERLKKLGESQ